jgi:APA family basic amino acid/polyamine antiporter
VGGAARAGDGAPEPGFRRVLGLWDATCVVVGAIIGVGIFFNPRDVANVTGSASAALLAWGIGGVIALLGAFHLRRARPAAAGRGRPVPRAARCLRPAAGVPLRVLQPDRGAGGAVAIIAIVCAQNLGVALHGGEPSERWVLLVATLLTWALVGVNVIGVRPGARCRTRR